MHTRTVHFPTRSSTPSAPAPPILPKPRPEKNPLQAYADALVNVNTCYELLQGLLATDNRHGSLQAARSITEELRSNITLLIENEETG